MADPPRARIDRPEPRPDLVCAAAREAESFPSAFGWINATEAIRVETAPENEGYTANEIRRLAIDWILDGKPIDCVPERREGYRDRRHFHYDIVIDFLSEFPRGFYIYMELDCQDEDTLTVNLLNAHPQRS